MSTSTNATSASIYMASSSASPAFNPTHTNEPFGNVPGVSKQLAELTLRADAARRQGQKNLPEPVLFYPVSYIRGEWMEQLLANGVGRKRVKFYLSDETLCLGTSEAPVTSIFRRPTVFYEAYLRGEDVSAAKVYLTDYQVDWLVDELYSKQGACNAKLEYRLFDVDRTRAVSRTDFAASRRVTFANAVAKFREKCGLSPSMTLPKPKEAKKPPSNARPQQSASSANLPQVSAPVPTPQQHPCSAPTSLTADSQMSSALASSQAVLNGNPPSTASSPPSYSIPSMKVDRRLRQQALREEMLSKHVAMQKANLPFAQRFYRNLARYGGVAMACDVESWTEDADVLLELGIAWKRWRRAADGTVVQEGGQRHYIIQETMQYRNEEIEATRDDYAHGSSETLPRRVVEERLHSLIKQMSSSKAGGPLVLVFHDASAESRYFQKLGVDVSSFQATIPARLTSSSSAASWSDEDGESMLSEQPDIIIQDTQNLYCGWSEPTVKQINLGKACAALGIQATKFHNAGNDAIATLKVWETLSAGPAAYEQREAFVKDEEEGPPGLHR